MILRGGNRLQKVKSQKLPLLNTFSYTIYVVSEKLRNPISFKLSCFSLKKSSQNRCPARNGSAVLSRIAWMWWQPALLAAVLVTSRLFSWTAAPPPALASLASSFFLLLLRSPMLNSQTKRRSKEVLALRRRALFSSAGLTCPCLHRDQVIPSCLQEIFGYVHSNWDFVRPPFWLDVKSKLFGAEWNQPIINYIF